MNGVEREPLHRKIIKDVIRKTKKPTLYILSFHLDSRLGVDNHGLSYALD